MVWLSIYRLCHHAALPTRKEVEEANSASEEVCRCSRRGQGGSRFRQAQKGVGGKQPRRVIHLRPALLLPHLHLKAVTRQISRVASHMEQERQRKRGQQCADASRRLQQLIVLLQQSARGAQSLILEPQCELVRCDLRTSTDTPKLKPAARQAARADLVRDTVTVSRFGSSARPAARTRRCGCRVQAMHTLER